jgi:hypothetical protein
MTEEVKTQLVGDLRPILHSTIENLRKTQVKYKLLTRMTPVEYHTMLSQMRAAHAREDMLQKLLLDTLKKMRDNRKYTIKIMEELNTKLSRGDNNVDG